MDINLLNKKYLLVIVLMSVDEEQFAFLMDLPTSVTCEQWNCSAWLPGDAQAKLFITAPGLIFASAGKNAAINIGCSTDDSFAIPHKNEKR